MQKRKLRDLEVSPVGMGCMGFSHGYGATPERSYTIEAIRAAADFGCTFFDTAEVYGREMFYLGHNEEMVGEALEPFRKNVVLATKFFLPGDEVAASNDIEKVIRTHLSASLKRLRTDYVDLYYLHRINENIPVEDVAGAIGRLIEEGVVRGWGLSQVSLELLERAHNVTPVTAVQSIYSMIERDLEKEIIPFCKANNIGVVPFSPIASGFLSGKVTTETKFEGDDVRKFVPQLSKENLVANKPILDMIGGFAEAKHATNAQISLAWMLKKYPHVVPIPGSKNRERILENLGAWNVELTDEEFAELEKALAACTIYGHRGNVETAQNTFSKHWLKAREAKA